MENQINLYDEFSRNNLIHEDLSNLYSYVFGISFTKISSLESAEMKRSIADLCIKELVLKLRSLELFGFDRIQIGEIKDSDEPVFLTYSDDIFGFTFSFSSTIIGFQKISCSVNNLLRTCDMLFDFFIEIYNKIIKFIQGTDEYILFIPNKTTHSFKYQLENFKSTLKRDKKRIPNYELMERIIPSLSVSDSPIGKVGYQTRGRTDLKMAGTISLNDIDWLTWITIEAPGNRNYSTMDLDFGFISEVNELPDGKRKPYNPESVLQWRDVFMILLKERVYKGFLQTWLNDVAFESTRK